MSGTLVSNCISPVPPGRVARQYTFPAGQNAKVVVTMRSSVFDPYLVLLRPDGRLAGSGIGTAGGSAADMQATVTDAGTYTIEASSPGGRATGAFELTLTTVAAGAPEISSYRGVVNGASFQPNIAGGSWITINGNNLAASSRLWSPSDFQGNALPRSLDGVSVKVNGRDAAVYYISPKQINALAPADTATGTVNVVVTNSKGSGLPVSATLQRYSPALFFFSPKSGVYPAAVHTNGTYVGPTDLFGGAAAAVPAQPKETILLFGTGFGPTAPAVDPMTVFSGAAPLEAGNDLIILVGSQRATVTFAGLVGNGLYQFNVVVPSLPDGEHLVWATIGGVSTPSLRLAVRNPPPVPVITKMSPAELIWGETAFVRLTGTGMTGVTGVEFSDPSQLRAGKMTVTATSVEFPLSVDANAQPGERTLWLVHPNGRSNPMTLSIRPGNPTITSFSLPVVYPDRIYAPIVGLYASARAQFRILGSDLAGVKSIVVDPGDGLRARGSVFAFREDVYSEFAVDADAVPGPRQLSVVSPAGASNSLPFEVQRPPAIVPAISNVTLQAPTLSPSNGRYGEITLRGSMTFTDGDGDIKPCAGPSAVLCKGGAFIRLMPLDVDFGGQVDITGAFLNFTGRTSGSINFTCIMQYSMSYMRVDTPTQVAVTLVDAADHPSNTVVVTVPNWMAPVL